MTTRQTIGRVILVVLALALVAAVGYALFQTGYHAGARANAVNGIQVEHFEFGRGSHVGQGQLPFHRPGMLGGAGLRVWSLPAVRGLPLGGWASLFAMGVVGAGTVLALQWAFRRSSGSTQEASTEEDDAA